MASIDPMTTTHDPLNQPNPRIAANVMHFARLLRRAGLPVGPAETIAAQEALTHIDLAAKTQACTALRTAMIHRHEHREVFDQAFALFWRDPSAAEQAAAMALLEAQKKPKPERAPPASRRVAEAFASKKDKPPQPKDEPPPIDMSMTVSEQERLQHMDFEAMGAAEINEAKREIRRLVLPLDLRRTRRLRPDQNGPVTDLRRTIRASLRQGGEILTIARNRRIVRPPPLVVLCDISGSMSRYAQILLHFLHAVTNDRDRVHVFLFGYSPVQRHAATEGPRSRGCVPDDRPRCTRLVRRHAHRRGRRQLQPPLGEASAGPRRRGAADHRRAGPRRRPWPGREHGPAPPLLHKAGMAQPAVALDRVRAKIPGHQGDAAACRRIPPGA